MGKFPLVASISTRTTQQQRRIYNTQHKSTNFRCFTTICFHCYFHCHFYFIFNFNNFSFRLSRWFSFFLIWFLISILRFIFNLVFIKSVPNVDTNASLCFVMLRYLIITLAQAERQSKNKKQNKKTMIKYAEQQEKFSEYMC